MTKLAMPLLLLSPLLLGGCVASLAAGAVGAAVNAASSGSREVVREDRRGVANEACRVRAAQQGEPHIIDTEQREDGTVTVWGTVATPNGRRSFECIHRGTIRSFKERPIRSN